NDADSRATMDVLMAIVTPASITDANLHCLVVGRTARLILDHGQSDASCMAYVNLGRLLGPYFGDYAKGFRFGKLGLDLVERRGLMRFKAPVHIPFAALILPWSRHVASGLGLIRRGTTAAEETGNIQFACYGRVALISTLLAKGDPLADVQREIE